jgi:hypothetical protein
MNELRQQEGNGKAPDDFMIVSRTEDGYRVYSALHPGNRHLVSDNVNDPACTCDAFAEDTTCEHVRAVQERFGAAQQVEQEERLAIQAEGQPSPKKKRKTATNDTPAVMTLKRSVSPDGRIDSLSVELSCQVEQVSAADIKSRAATMLKLQSEIAGGFLNANGKKNGHGNGNPGNQASKTAETQPIPAKMLSIGSTNGKWGPRFFISFQANGQALKLFGTTKQLAESVIAAGFTYREEDVVEGVYLNLPCRIVTKPSADGRFLNIDRVLPGSVSPPQRRA